MEDYSDHPAPERVAASVRQLQEALDRTLADLHALVHHPENTIPETFEEPEDDTQPTSEDAAIPREPQDDVVQPKRRPSQTTRTRTQTPRQKILEQYTRLEKQLKLIAQGQNILTQQIELEITLAKTDKNKKAEQHEAEEKEALATLEGWLKRAAEIRDREEPPKHIQGGPGVYEKLMNMHKRE
jgi:hypothetical protein